MSSLECNAIGYIAIIILQVQRGPDGVPYMRGLMHIIFICIYIYIYIYVYMYMYIYVYVAALNVIYAVARL